MQVVSGQATLGCDAGNFTQGVANISNLQTSAQLLNNTLSFLGAPSNSTVFLPTDAAWASFRAANGAAHAHACIPPVNLVVLQPPTFRAIADPYTQALAEDASTSDHVLCELAGANAPDTNRSIAILLYNRCAQLFASFSAAVCAPSVRTLCKVCVTLQRRSLLWAACAKLCL